MRQKPMFAILASGVCVPAAPAAAQPARAPARAPAPLPLWRLDGVAVQGNNLDVFPDAAELYERAGWVLPTHIDRVYDPALAERVLGFRCRTDFAAVLEALRTGSALPFAHDPSYVSPKERLPAKGA